MLKYEAQFFVPGDPQPKGNHRIMFNRGNPRIYEANNNVSGWEALIRGACLQNRPKKPLKCAFRLDVTFVFIMPKTVKRLYHTVRPDRDKLLRAVQDALTGLIWVDDSQVIRGDTIKIYGKKAGAHIFVKSIEPEEQIILDL